MDQETAQQIADLRYQLEQLRSALSVQTPDAAELKVQQLAGTVEALVAWAVTVNPPFPGSGG